MSQTRKNLEQAFAGESMASRRYEAFAAKAEDEGYSDIAELFRKRAREEAAHALELVRRLGIGKSTRDNLQYAISGETREFKSMYPDFAKQARETGDTDSANFFKALAEIEKHHAEEFQKALNRLDGKELKWQCSVCGYTHTGEQPPARCPRCGAVQKHFHIIE